MPRGVGYGSTRPMKKKKKKKKTKMKPSRR